MDADPLDRILRDRGISVDKSDLTNALQNSCDEELQEKNSQSPFAKWATQYLGTDTLLTPDELDTYITTHLPLLSAFSAF
jgi:hypothetical protein